jgi:hypothetical protein
VSLRLAAGYWSTILCQTFVKERGALASGRRPAVPQAVLVAKNRPVLLPGTPEAVIIGKPREIH